MQTIITHNFANEEDDMNYQCEVMQAEFEDFEEFILDINRE